MATRKSTFPTDAALAVAHQWLDGIEPRASTYFAACPRLPDIADGRGLVARITPPGDIGLFFRYREPGGGRVRYLKLKHADPRTLMLALGEFAALKASRHDHAAELLPAEQRRKERDADRRTEAARRRDYTVRKAVEDYLAAKAAELRPATLREYKRILSLFADSMGRRPMLDVDRDRCEDWLAPLRAEGKARQFNASRTVLSMLFRWVDREGPRELRGHVGNPVATLPGLRGGNGTRDKTLRDPDRLALWAALAERDDQHANLVKLVMLTGQRIGETALAEWAHIQGAEWTLPAANTKSRREQVVVLSAQARAVLEMQRSRARGSRYVFPRTRDRRLPGEKRDLPMRGDTASKVVASELQAAGLARGLTAHCLRSSLMTWAIENIHRLDARVDATQLRHRMLAHQPADRLDAAYVKADSSQPAAEAWQRYADHLDVLIGKQASPAVVRLEPGKGTR